MAGAWAGAWAVAWAGAWAVAVAGAIFFLPAFFIAWRIRKEDTLFAGLRQFGLQIGSLGGANFRGANLTEARFRGTHLKRARFSVSELKRANFRDAKHLEFAYAKGTSLENPRVRRLLVSGEGAGKSYAGLNLKGAFLAEARLGGADFTEADLSGADLTHADLRDARLVKTQLIGVRLTRARLTGACIAAWNIDKSVDLREIDCDHVFLESGDPPKFRQPPSGTFEPDEFSKLFQEMTETMDFIVHSRLELAALLQAVRKRREEGAEELQVQGWEQKGDFAVVHVAAPPDAERERVYEELQREKEVAIKLLEAEYKARLLGKDEQIHSLEKRGVRLENLLSDKGNTYIESVGGNAVTHTQTITDSTIIGATLNQGDIQGRLTNLAKNIGALPAADTEAKAKLEALVAGLAEELEKVPQEQAGDAEAVTNMLERTVADAEKGNPSLLKGTIEGLKHSARSLEGYPAVLEVVTEIAKLFGE